MGITLRDIERESGVSRSMVERIINNKRTKDDEKRRIVLETVKRLDYNPLNNIPVIKRIKTNSIGVMSHVTSTMDNAFYSRFINAVKRELSKTGHDCLLYTEDDIIKRTAITGPGGRLVLNCEGLILFVLTRTGTNICGCCAPGIYPACWCAGIRMYRGQPL